MIFANYLRFVVDSKSHLLYRLTCRVLYYVDRFNAKTRKSAVIPFLNRYYAKLQVVLFDLGAAGGIDPIYQLLVGLPNFKAIGFDPDKQDMESLEITSKIRFYPHAIAGNSGKRTLHITKSRGCSSLYPPNEKNLKEYSVSDLFQVVRTEELDVITLDEFIEQNNVPYPDFLKMDVQGAEYEIFKESARTLDNVIGISFETRLREIYKGEGLSPASHSLLARLGFRLISKVGRSPHFDGETLEVEMAYVRGIDSLTTEEKLVKAVLFCVCHENLTFAAHLVSASSLASEQKSRFLKMLRKDFGFPGTPETCMLKFAVERDAHKRRA